MSTKAYSSDLRIRVIQHIEEGNTQQSACQVFKVSKSGVNRWWKRYKEEGTIEAKPRQGSKGKIDQKALEEYVKSHPDKTLKEIAQKYNVTIAAIWKRLKSLGFSYKKKRSPTWKQMNKSEQAI